MKTFFVAVLSGFLIFAADGCATHRQKTNGSQSIVTVSSDMVRSNKFFLVWDSIYEHQTNIFLHGNGSKDISVTRNTNIVYNIYSSTNPTIPMSRWRRIATVSTTNYLCTVTNFPYYFTVRSMDVRSGYESQPAR
jgi:hypothetical protein